ncbi:hypothetical protein Hanom_Chr14g01329771 [Helianthus anomalus]
MYKKAHMTTIRTIAKEKGRYPPLVNLYNTALRKKYSMEHMIITYAITRTILVCHTTIIITTRSPEVSVSANITAIPSLIRRQKYQHVC